MLIVVCTFPPHVGRWRYCPKGFLPYTGLVESANTHTNSIAPPEGPALGLDNQKVPKAGPLGGAIEFVGVFSFYLLVYPRSLPF